MCRTATCQRPHKGVRLVKQVHVYLATALLVCRLVIKTIELTSVLFAKVCWNECFKYDTLQSAVYTDVEVTRVPADSGSGSKRFVAYTRRGSTCQLDNYMTCSIIYSTTTCKVCGTVCYLTFLRSGSVDLEFCNGSTHCNPLPSPTHQLTDPTQE